MGRTNVAVIGSGNWGPNLVRNFAQLSSANLVAVADIREDRLAEMKARYPKIAVTRDYRELFSMAVDAIVVATPPSTHYSIARECLQQNLHVLVEKPLTLNSRDAADLIRVAQIRGLTLMVGHTLEYHAGVRALRDLIAAGELGRIYYADVVWVNLGRFRSDLSVLWDLAPHDISLLLYLFGQDPIAVSAQGSANIFWQKHDVVHLHLAFPGDMVAHVQVSWLHPQKQRRVTIVGNQKMAVLDDEGKPDKLRVYDKGVDMVCVEDGSRDFRCSYRNGNVVVPSLQFTEPLRVECEHFVECASNGTTPTSSGLSGLKVVEILEAAEESLCSGGIPVDLSTRRTELTRIPVFTPTRPVASTPIAAVSPGV